MACSQYERSLTQFHSFLKKGASLTQFHSFLKKGANKSGCFYDNCTRHDLSISYFFYFSFQILPETKPASTPTSPLLTSLLQSPSPLQRSSLSSTPTISNLLNSAPAIPHYSNGKNSLLIRSKFLLSGLQSVSKSLILIFYSVKIKL